MPALIFYDRSVTSGLGDRFGIYLCLAALAKIAEVVCCTYWSNDLRSGPDRHYRWDVIRRLIKMPSTIVLSDEVEFRALSNERRCSCVRYNGNELPSSEGYDCVYTLAHKALSFSERAISQIEMMRAYRLITKEWQIDLGTSLLLPSKPYIVLHLRGQDKRGPFDRLRSDFQTHYLLANLPAELDAVAITDDDDLANYYLERHPQVRCVPNDLDSVEQNDLKGLAVMMGASAIIQHAENGWSAYSSVVAMARGIPLLNTYVGPGLNRLSLFHNRGGCPAELLFYTNGRAEEFLSLLRSLKQ